MKRILSFFILASVLLASSCSLKEDFKGNDSEFATISLTLGGPESSATRAIGDGLSVDLLHYAVYDSNNELIPALGKVVEVQKFPTQVDITLAKGQTYKIAFWAQNQSTGAYTINNGDVRHVAINYAGYNNNDESRDAFFKTIEHTVTGDIALNVVLERPFAQINLGVTAEDWAAAETAGISVEKSKVKISNAASALDLFSGQVGAGTEVVYELAEIPALSGEILTVEEVAYKYLSMNYILVNSQDATAPAQGLYGEGKELVNAEFTLVMADTQDQDVVVKVDNLPVQRNWRTNVIGRMLTGDISFNISLDPIFDGEENYPDNLEEELYFAALNGGEVTLTGNVQLTDPIIVKKNMIVNLNGKTIINKVDNQQTDVFIVESDASLTINGEGIIEAVTGNDGYAIVSEGTVVINGGTFKAGKDANNEPNAIVYARGNGKVFVNGGKFPNENNSTFVLNKKDADRQTTIIEVRGGEFYNFNPQNNAAEGANTNFVAEGYKAIEKESNLFHVVKNDVDVIVGNDDSFSNSLKNTTDTDLVIYLTNDVTVDVAAWMNDAFGGTSTNTITIEGNNHKITFNQTNSDWNNIVTNGAKLIIKNAYITNSGHNDGPWNRHDLNFACEVELVNVVSDKAIALKAGATLNKVTINDKNTSDTYAIWIQPKGQEVVLNECTIDMLDCTDGRGIKIDEQYVDAPEKVTLKVSNTKFSTEEKSAILVKSKAGAEIVLSNVDITNVDADKVYPVWVDEASEAYYNLVVVSGGLKRLEGATAVSNDEGVADAIKAGKKVIYLNEGSYIIPNEAKGKTLTFIGVDNAANTKINTQVQGSEGCDYSLDGSTVRFENISINTTSKTYTGYARMNGTYVNCIINGTYTLYGDSSFEGCTFNVSGDVYNIWTWGAPKAVFNNCTFNSDGKAMLLYGQVNTKLTINNSIFNDNGGLTDLKAAIEIGNDYNTSYNLVVNNTKVYGYEINPNGISTGTTLWANKNSMPKDKLNVVVDGVDVY